MRETCSAAGRTIRDLRIRHETGAIVVALRKRGRHVRHDARAGHADRGRRRADRRRLAGRDPARSKTSSRRRDRCRLIPSDARGRARRRGGRRARARAAGRAGARRLRDERRAAARRRAAPAAARDRGGDRGGGRRRSPVVERAEVAGPGFVNLFLRDEWFASALARDPRGGDAYGGGGRDRRERVQVEMVSANPTGPITVASARNGAYGDSRRAAARARGPRGRARVLLQRRGRADGPVPRLGRGGAARGGAARGRLPAATYIARSRRADGRPGRRDAEGDRGDARALPHPLRLWRRQSELEQRAARARCRGSTRTRRTARSGRARRAYGDDKDRVAPPLGRTARRPTAPPTSPTSWTSSSAASTARSTSSAPTTTARRNWYAAVARMLGYDPERVEVLLYQLVHLTRGGEQTKMSKRRGDVVFLDEFMDEIGVDAARWYLVNRGPDQTIEIDVDLAAERSQKNPVYYVQYAHARIAGILRNAPDNASNSLLLAGAARAGGARADQAARRAAGGRRRRAEKRGPQGDPDVRDPRRRRLPPLLPRAPRARERAGGVPARPLPRDADRDRALPRPRRGRGT